MSVLSRAAVAGSTTRRWIGFVVGVVVLSAGIACAISAGLGVATWDTLGVAVAGLTGWSVGAAHTLNGVVVMLSAIPLGVRPNLATGLTAVTIGPLIDGWLVLLGEPAVLAGQVGLLAAAVVGVAAGLSLYLGAEIGYGPHDALAGAALQRGYSMRTVKIATDVVTTALGWALGGPVGAGTVVLVLAPGWLLGRLEAPARQLLHGPTPERDTPRPADEPLMA